MINTVFIDSGGFMENSKGFFGNAIFPVVAVSILVVIFLPICKSDGQIDYFLLWIWVGCPFGIRKMFAWLVPRNFGLAGTVGVIALNFIIGGLLGGAIALYRILYAIFYILRIIIKFLLGR